MRCMTAIWPAGPPKLSIATRSQPRNASARDGKGRIAAAAPAAATDTASVMSCPVFLGMPGMRLLGGVPAPAVERVVERHPGFELREVVGIHARQPERGREQAGGLRRLLEA